MTDPPRASFGFPSPPRSPSSLATVGHTLLDGLVSRSQGRLRSGHGRTRHVQDAASLCARFSGSGSPLVLLHDGSVSSCTWLLLFRVPFVSAPRRRPPEAVEIRAHGRWTALSVSLMSRGQWATSDVGSCAASFGSPTAENASPRGPRFLRYGSFASARRRSARILAGEYFRG